jgi:hypothetical protein
VHASHCLQNPNNPIRFTVPGGILKKVKHVKGKKDLNELFVKYKEHEAGLYKGFSKAFADEEKSLNRPWRILMNWNILIYIVS